MTLNKAAHISRADEIHYILTCVANAECCAIVGLSNMGKSVLLRSVKSAVSAGFGRARPDDYAIIYIDFNLMVEMTEQAFYELILRSVRPALEGGLRGMWDQGSGHSRRTLPDERTSFASPASSTIDQPQVRERIEEAYRKVVDSSNPFLVPLGFNEGIMALCERLNRRVVLLFDEFDEPFSQIDSRVFLNLRALKDRYDRQLCYVVATCERLEEMRQGSEIGEFCEMFAHQTLWLRPMGREDTREAVAEFMTRENLPPTARDVDFVWVETGGHPGLVQVVCHVLTTTGGGESDDDHDIVRDKLSSDPNVRSECVKLWNGLDEREQQTLIDFVSGEGQERSALAPLLQNGLLRQIDTKIDVFGVLFRGFVRRQRLVKGPYPLGVRVDVDSGGVWVDGKRTPTLTELEFRLLLLFYGRIGSICDKFQIVEAVWGEDYIDRVDDARIEKLVSRLRKKIEPDPSEPRYLQTVRGRGYRLVEV